MSLQFEPVWSWAFAIGVFIAAAVITRSAYPRRIRHLPASRQRLLMLCRTAFLALLFLASLRPALVLEKQDESEAVIYLVSDASRSMQTADEPGGITRRDSLRKLLEKVSPSLAELAEKFEIRRRDFAENTAVVEDFAPAADGPFTAIGKSLESLLEEMGDSLVPAVVLLSDGRQAAPGKLDTNPEQIALRLGLRQRPIYTVGFGTAQAGSGSADLALTDPGITRDVFQGNTLPISIRLKAAGATGQPVTVRVLLENRTGLGDGQTGPLEPVPLSNEARSIVQLTPTSVSEEHQLTFQVVPEQLGDLKLAVEAIPLPGEARQTNNRIETIIRVRRGGIRVALFDVVRSEQKWLRQINDSSRIQLDFHPIRSGAFRAQNRIPDRFFQPGSYDAYVIGDVPASAFSPEQLLAMTACCKQGAGLMMIGGAGNFGAGGYAQSPLSELLPVELPSNNAQLTSPQKMLPARDGLAHFVMQIAPADQNRGRWEQLPPLTGGNLLAPRNNSLAQVLAASPDGAPLLIGLDTGRNRSLAFAGDTTWQWAMLGFAEDHLRFWRQVIFWLTRKETDDSQAVWIQAEPRDLTPGAPATLTVGARDAQGLPVSDAEFAIEITDPKGKLLPVTPRREIAASTAEFTETLEPGDYWARVRASRAGQPFGNIGVTRFHVVPNDPERDNPAAEFDVLRRIAENSGGQFLTQEQFIEKLQTWAEDGLPGMNLKRQERIPLWDTPPVLLLLIALLTVEWGIRRRSQLM
jgi:uncharacterized membrane protein